MIKRDFHNWKLTDAVQEIHSIVGSIRTSKKPMQVELITGNGVIKVVAMEILESYKLVPVVRWGNSGTIDVVVE